MKQKRKESCALSPAAVIELETDEFEQPGTSGGRVASVKFTVYGQDIAILGEDIHIMKSKSKWLNERLMNAGQRMHYPNTAGFWGAEGVTIVCRLRFLYGFMFVCIIVIYIIIFIIYIYIYIYHKMAALLLEFTKLLFALSSLAQPFNRVRSIPEYLFIILSQRKSCAGRF